MVTGGVRGCRMVQASPQVTAAQVLDAGRRAEADGRIEYAVQFYRHLTDHHSGAPEAVAAREALSRLKRQGSFSDQASRMRPANPPPLRGSHRGTDEMKRAGPKVGRGPIRIAPVGAGPAPARMELPVPPADYFTGRLIAYAFAGVGGLIFLAGLLLAVAVAVMPAEVAARIPAWMPVFHPLTGTGAAMLGLVLVFSGQVGRALFDLAIASRDIAAIERAKLEHAIAEAS